MESLNLLSRARAAWNVFRNRDPTDLYSGGGYSATYRVDQPRFSGGNERTIATAVFNKIALDVADLDIRHVYLDDQGRYFADKDSGLNRCFTVEANEDQTPRAFIQDAIITMFDEGHVALVPVDTDVNPNTGAFDIETMRTGKVVEWYPHTVKVYVYCQETQRREYVKLPKSSVAIVENPFYAVMNERNSTLKRLINKLALLDAIDQQNGSGKLDLIVQLPVSVRTETRKRQATDRLKSIEDQLKGPYGIAYIDSTERVTQLNRPVENNLMKQIEYLTNTFYSQLGITQAILDGTADEQTMTNYYNRTIEPIISAIVDEMKRKFLSKTARTRGQTIKWFRDPFKIMSVTAMAPVIDTLCRNEVISSNEGREMIGRKPSTDPNADLLRNSNMPHENGDLPVPTETEEDPYYEEGYEEEYEEDPYTQ